MHYLLDGYNFLFSVDLAKSSLQTTRNQLISYLQKAFRKKKIKGTLVFDGAHREEEESGLSYHSPLVVAYAPQGISADDYIIEKVEVSKNPKLIKVITNDRGLIRKIKDLGAKSSSNEEFAEWLGKEKNLPSHSKAQDSPKEIERLLKIFEKKLKDLD